MTNENPIQLYRYRGINSNTIKTLCSDELYFSDPTSFNDPLDCSPFVESDSDKDTLQKILTELITQRVEKETRSSLSKAKLDDGEIYKHSKKVARQEASNSLNRIAYLATDMDRPSSLYESECDILRDNIQDELIRRYDHGVCCFSADYRNPLLWSHYGDQHRGICIGYTADSLTLEREYLSKVEYGGSRKITTSLIADALLGKNEKSQNDLDKKILFRKAPSWEYEKEWRMVGSRGLHRSTLWLKDITFGLRCSKEYKYLIFKAFQKRSIALYQMSEVVGTFQLKRDFFDDGELQGIYPANNRAILDALLE